MADINLLKDTESLNEGKGLNKPKPHGEIELRAPREKTTKKGGLSEEAPESIWSKLFGRRSKPKTEEKKMEAITEKERKMGKISAPVTAEPQVMAHQDIFKKKEVTAKSVKMPYRPPLRFTAESEPFIKEEKKEEPAIFSQAEEKKTEIPLPKEIVKEKKESFWSKLFRKPLVKKTPEPIPFTKKYEAKGITQKEEYPAKFKPAVKREIPKPIKEISKAETPLPSPVVEPKKEGFFARLFKKPQIDKVPEAAIIKEVVSEKGKQKIEEEPKEKKDKGAIKEQPKLTEAEMLAPSALEVNLMPEELEANVVLARQRLMQIGFIALGTLIIFILIYIGLIFYGSNLKSQTSQLENQLTGVEDEIKGYREVQQQAINLKKKTDAIKELLDKHVYWTTFFQKLEEYTIKDVYYQSFSGDLSGGRINLTARAKTFLDVGRQLLVLQGASDFVESVEISSAKLSSESITVEGGESAEKPVVDFSISLKVVRAAFSQPSEKITE